MSRIQLIKNEITIVKAQTNKLIKDIPDEQWVFTPEIMNTNLNWQIGHIFLANYLHGIASITGPSEIIRNSVNIKEYIQYYGLDSNPKEHLENKPTTKALLEVLNISYDLIFKGIDELTEEDLNQSTAIPNPAVKTKYEALMWLFKHQSWHNGQIAMLSRVLNS